MRKSKKSETEASEKDFPNLGKISQKNRPVSLDPSLTRKKNKKKRARVQRPFSHPKDIDGSFPRALATGQDPMIDLGDSPPISLPRGQNLPFTFGTLLCKPIQVGLLGFFCNTYSPECICPSCNRPSIKKCTKVWLLRFFMYDSFAFLLFFLFFLLFLPSILQGSSWVSKRATWEIRSWTSVVPSKKNLDDIGAGMLN